MTIFALSLGVLVLIATGFAGPPKEVEARRFIVKDAAGRERIFLGMNAKEKSANLSFNDKDGRPAFFMTILDNGGSGGTLSDGQGKDRMTFGVGKDGEVRFTIYNQAGKPIFSVP